MRLLLELLDGYIRFLCLCIPDVLELYSCDESRSRPKLELTQGRHAGAFTEQALPLSAGVILASLPLWWCIACPTVTAILFPLIINFSCWWIAQLLCKILHVPKDTVATVYCFCLRAPEPYSHRNSHQNLPALISWVAILVAMILSLASAWPIYLICELPKCAQGHPNVFNPIIRVLQQMRAALMSE